jgi:uncharacterized membrane protein
MVYNPSEWNRRLRVSCLAAIAALIATYMGLYQLGLIDHAWDPLFPGGTERVLDSQLSHTMKKWMRIPDALLGAIAYIGDVIFALAGSSRRWQDRPWLVILFGIDVIPLGVVSALLISMQGTIVGAWCSLCLVTACISVTLIFLAYGEIRASLLLLRGVWKRSRDRRLLWDTFWGRPSQTAYEVGLLIERR